MKKLIVVGMGAIGSAAAATALFSSGVAAADGYAGQTYSDAASAASNAGLSVTIASRFGDRLPIDECLVTRSQGAPYVNPGDSSHASGIVVFYLNCAGGYATATSPGSPHHNPTARTLMAEDEAKAAAHLAEQQAACEIAEREGRVGAGTCRPTASTP